MMTRHQRIPIEKLRITVVYDYNPGAPGIAPDWGFACLIKGTPQPILFDTGGDGTILLGNLGRLGIAAAEIGVIFLSHFHGDHTGGLAHLLQKNKHATVCYPASFPAKFSAGLNRSGVRAQALRSAAKIADGVYSTGELGTWIKEQSLMIPTEMGTVLITGCAHPGIVKIVAAARAILGSNVYFVMGGFHLGGLGENQLAEIITGFKKLGVTSVGPCHCSGDTARGLFKNAYGRDYVTIGAGSVIRFERRDHV
ncbi:MAG: MBL fold metallo-hydrolase [Desulfobacteraceae bacterium]|jgi:7,8-dihydropterin-6-yl-methyl-4-(beta-D-ribofuranosyl)aminobenzene 5'-phosphate synthase